MKKLNQKGFGVVEGLLILVIVGILGGVGWFVYDSNKKTNEVMSNTGNSQVTPSKVTSPTAALTEFVNKEVPKIEKLVGPNCSNAMRESNKKDWVIANAELKYYEDGEMSDYQKSNKVSSDYLYANIAYGCGSQGSTYYVVKKVNNEWKVVAQSATVYSQCEDVEGQDVPAGIMPQCYDKNGSLVNTK